MADVKSGEHQGALLSRHTSDASRSTDYETSPALQAGYSAVTDARKGAICCACGSSLVGERDLRQAARAVRVESLAAGERSGKELAGHERRGAGERRGMCRRGHRQASNPRLRSSRRRSRRRRSWSELARTRCDASDGGKRLVVATRSSTREEWVEHRDGAVHEIGRGQRRGREPASLGRFKRGFSRRRELGPRADHEHAGRRTRTEARAPAPAPRVPARAWFELLGHALHAVGDLRFRARRRVPASSASAASWFRYVFVAATASSGPASSGSTASATCASSDAGSFVTATVNAPRRRARSRYSTTSGVDPTATARAPSSPVRSKRRRSRR